MKHLLSSLLIFASMSTLAFSVAQAQPAKVIKVKGQQAIVQFPAGIAPVVGQNLDVGGGGGDSSSGAPVRRGSREHLLGFDGSLSFSSVSTGGSKINFLVAGRYGWNLETIEFGPVAAIRYSSVTGQSDRTLVGGGFFDFNFVPNVSGQPLIYGVGAQASFGQHVQTTTTDVTDSVIDLFIGGNTKWFGLSDTFAIRADAGLNIVRNSTVLTTTNETGLLIKAGLAVYY